MRLFSQTSTTTISGDCRYPTANLASSSLLVVSTLTTTADWQSQPGLQLQVLSSLHLVGCSATTAVADVATPSTGYQKAKRVISPTRDWDQFNRSAMGAQVPDTDTLISARAIHITDCVFNENSAIGTVAVDPLLHTVTSMYALKLHLKSRNTGFVSIKQYRWVSLSARQTARGQLSDIE
jgi:hypothetical protein